MTAKALVLLLVSVYCDTPQDLGVLAGVNVLTAQALVLLLVSTCCDSPSLGVVAGVNVL